MAVRKLSLPLFTRKDRSLAAPLLYTSLPISTANAKRWYRAILDASHNDDV